MAAVWEMFVCQVARFGVFNKIAIFINPPVDGGNHPSEDRKVPPGKKMPKAERMTGYNSLAGTVILSSGDCPLTKLFHLPCHDGIGVDFDDEDFPRLGAEVPCVAYILSGDVCAQQCIDELVGDDEDISPWGGWKSPMFE